jgi:glycosyltransferase involved in cell wall biosynthesis/GT2 family glycosyltransferase
MTDNLENKKLSILFISHSAARGGAELALLELVHGFLKRNIKCSVVLPNRGYLYDELEKVGAVLYVTPVPWWIYNKEDEKRQIRQSITNSCLDIAKIVNQNNFDFIYTNTCVIPEGAVVAREFGIPHIWHIQEFGEKDHGLKFLLNFKERAKFIYNNSIKINFNSKILKKDFDEVIPEDKSSIYYYNIELPIIEENKSDLYKVKDSLKLLLVGNIMEGKGQLDALKAIKYCFDKYKDNLELILLGNINSVDYYQTLNKFIIENYLDKFVVFYNFINNPTSVYASADVVLMCSRAEAFGRVTVEAMLMGKPVIGANAGATPEIIKDNYSGLLYESGNYKDLGDKIHTLFNNNEKIKFLGQNAKKFVSDKFNEQKYSGAISASLEKTISEGYLLDENFSFIKRILEINHNYELEIKDKEKSLRQIDNDLKLKDFEIQSNNKIIKENGEKIEKQVREIDDKNTEIDLIKNELILSKSQLDTTKSQLDLRVNELLEIYKSRGWRSVLFIRKISNKIFPRETLRRRAASFLFKLCRKCFRFFRKIIKPNKEIKLFKRSVIYLVKRAVIIFKTEGLSVLKRKIIGSVFFKNKIFYHFKTTEIISFSRKHNKINFNIGKEKLSVVMLTLNRADDTKKTIEYLYSNIPFGFELIILDNGSDEETVNFLRKLKPIRGNLKIIYEKENLGCAGGRRKAFSLASGDYILSIDNDIFITPYTVENLINILRKNNKVVGACCKTIFPNGLIQFNGGDYNINGKFVNFNLLHTDKKYNDSSTMEEVDCGWIPGGATLWRKDILKKFRIDPEMEGSYEDNDFSFVLRKEGFYLSNSPKSFAIHNHLFFNKKVLKDLKYIKGRYDIKRTVSAIKTFYIKHGLLINDYWLFGKIGVLGLDYKKVIEKINKNEY